MTRHAGRALAALLLLGASPLAAQTAQDGFSASSTLEDLIPNSATADPEAWAAEGAPEQPVPDPPIPDQGLQPSPDAPLAEDAGFELAWPDLERFPEIEQLEPDEDIRFADFNPEPVPLLDGGQEVRVSSRLRLVFPPDPASFPLREELADRFEALSAIVELDGNGDDAARLAARAREDERLLDRLLSIYGYFGAQVIRSVEVDEGDKAQVRFAILPGAQYTFGTVELGELDDGGYPELRPAFAIQPGDPLLQDRIVGERMNLSAALGEAGYPFTEVGEPELLVDHAREEGDLTMPVTPGGQYRFGRVNSNLPDFLSSAHLEEIASFEPGELYRASDEADLRRAILATGLVGGLTITANPVEPAEGSEPGVVDIDVRMTRAPLRTWAGALGYGTGEGLRAEASWEHRNLFPPEGMLRLRGILGTREQLAGVTFRRNNFHGRDRVLSIDAFASTQNREAYEAKTVSLTGTYERRSTLLLQKPLSWSIGLEAVATAERETDTDGRALGPEETYFIGAVPLMVQFDSSDDLLDPHEGFRIAGRVSPEYSIRDGNGAFYLRGQADASYYLPAEDSVVVAARARVSSIVGASIEAVAPSRRYYAGGGASVRGYGYQAIGVDGATGEANGGRSLAEFSIEARVQTGLMDGALSVVPFIDAGTVGDSTLPTFDDVRFGAGIGVRYETSFGPLRLDVGTPVNPRPEDSRIGVYVGLGQAF